ncbi:MAG: hypothetical protein Q9226_008305, partial [Calogaya cf. arnoldii]
MDISNRGVDDEATLADRNYIRWDAEGVEKIAENEEKDIKAVADMINTIQKAQWNNHRHCYSGNRHPLHPFDALLIPHEGTHARTQGIIKAKLI